MLQILVVALGGAFGSLFRFLLSSWVEGYFRNRAFPFGIFACNVVGSFAIGIIIGLMLNRAEPDVLWRLFLIVGLCGGFTTFSSFSIDNIMLLRSGSVGVAFVNILLSVGVCLLVTYLGMLMVGVRSEV